MHSLDRSASMFRLYVHTVLIIILFVSRNEVHSTNTHSLHKAGL